MKEEVRALFENTDRAIAARQPMFGLFEMAQHLRGAEKFLIDLVLNKKFAVTLVNKLNEIRMSLYEVYLDQVGAYVHIVESADDFGSQNGPLISPKLFREIFLPAYKELHLMVKRKAPNAKIFMHSDGAIVQLIPDFIASEVEVMNPIEPDVPGNDPIELKKKFGSELVFHGHLNNKGPMHNSLQEVYDEFNRIRSTIAMGGGFILAPSNHFQADVPPANIVALYQFATEKTKL